MVCTSGVRLAPNWGEIHLESLETLESLPWNMHPLCPRSLRAHQADDSRDVRNFPPGMLRLLHPELVVCCCAIGIRVRRVIKGEYAKLHNQPHMGGSVDKAERNQLCEPVNCKAATLYSHIQCNTSTIFDNICVFPPSNPQSRLSLDQLRCAPS